MDKIQHIFCLGAYSTLDMKIDSYYIFFPIYLKSNQICSLCIFSEYLHTEMNVVSDGKWSIHFTKLL